MGDSSFLRKSTPPCDSAIMHNKFASLCGEFLTAAQIPIWNSPLVHSLAIARDLLPIRMSIIKDLDYSGDDAIILII